MTIQREQLEADVLIVGAGPAGLGFALHLANLITKHNASGAKPELSPENIYVLEKGRDVARTSFPARSWTRAACANWCRISRRRRRSIRP